MLEGYIHSIKGGYFWRKTQDSNKKRELRLFTPWIVTVILNLFYNIYYLGITSMQYSYITSEKLSHEGEKTVLKKNVWTGSSIWF